MKNIEWVDFLNKNLKKTKINNLYRYRKIIQYSSGRFLIYKNKKYINFSSNDYLGLGKSNKIVKAWKYGLDKYGLSTCSSCNVIGYHKIHKKLEKKISKWMNYDNALLFISGYYANQNIITTLMNKNDNIFADRLSHASLIESSIFSFANLKRFKHNDIDMLEKLLTNYSSGKKLVITEGIFSMDGDSPELEKMIEIVKNNNSWLFVDDAHGIGVTGNEGRGTCFEQRVKPDLLMISFSKAFGLSGAALLCNNNVYKYFLQFSKNLMYSTFMMPAQAFAIYKAISFIRKLDSLREKLRSNIEFFKQLINKYNIPFLNSNSCIQILILGKNELALRASNFLRKRGVYVQPIRPPSVPNLTSRLRIILTSEHSFEDIEKLIIALNIFINKKN